jgi:hypothetical protein
MPTRHFPDRNRLSILTAVIVLAYALARFLELPSRALSSTFLGSALGFELDGALLMQVLVAALICSGADTLFRSHPAHIGRSTLVHWILPGALALVLGAVLNRLPMGALWLGGMTLAAMVLGAVLVAEYTLLDRADPAWEWATVGITALTYGVAATLFVFLHNLSTRALVSASIGGVVASLLAARLFLLHDAPLYRAGLYAALVGLIVAQTMWAVSYWRTTSFGAAIVTLIPMYLSAGLAHQHLAQRLTRRVWIEFAIVGGISLVIALWLTGQ